MGWSTNTFTLMQNTLKAEVEPAKEKRYEEQEQREGLTRI